MSGGPTASELLRLLDQCDLSNSHCSTPCISPCPAAAAATRIKPSNVVFLNQSQQTVVATTSSLQHPVLSTSSHPNHSLHPLGEYQHQQPSPMLNTLPTSSATIVTQTETHKSISTTTTSTTTTTMTVTSPPTPSTSSTLSASSSSSSSSEK